MSLYILMTKLSSDLVRDPRGREAVGNEWKSRVDTACPEVKWVAHYALLGPYDFMDIYEAPTHAVAHEVSLISRASGALTAECWPAMPYEAFLDLTRSADAVLHDA